MRAISDIPKSACLVSSKSELTVIFDWNYGIINGSKGNKSIFFCSDTAYTKTKFPTLVTSNTDESHGLGAFGTVKYNALSGISLPYVTQSKIILRQNVGNYFHHKYTKFHEKEHHRMTSYIIWNISIIPPVEYVDLLGLLTSNLHSLRSETTFGIGEKAWNTKSLVNMMEPRF